MRLALISVFILFFYKDFCQAKRGPIRRPPLKPVEKIKDILRAEEDFFKAQDIEKINDPNILYNIAMKIRTEYEDIDFYGTESLRKRERSTAFFEKAATMGHRESQYQMGLLETDVIGGEYIRWMNRAANQGHILAQLRLSVFLLEKFTKETKNPFEREDIEYSKEWALEAYKWHLIFQSAPLPLRELYFLKGEIQIYESRFKKMEEKVFSAKEIAQARKEVSAFKPISEMSNEKTNIK